MPRVPLPARSPLFPPGSHYGTTVAVAPPLLTIARASGCWSGANGRPARGPWAPRTAVAAQIRRHCALANVGAGLLTVTEPWGDDTPAESVLCERVPARGVLGRCDAGGSVFTCRRQPARRQAPICPRPAGLAGCAVGAAADRAARTFPLRCSMSCGDARVTGTQVPRPVAFASAAPALGVLR